MCLSMWKQVIEVYQVVLVKYEVLRGFLWKSGLDAS